MVNVLEQVETLQDLEALQRQVKAKIAEKVGGCARLLDTIIREGELKNDAALGRLLDLPASTISSLRHGRKPLTASMMICIHEEVGMSIKRIKELAAV